MVVRGRVPTGGVVAAADVPARLAHPEMDPAHALREALLAAAHLLGELENLDVFDMGARGHGAYGD
jgi:hypothetical protein